MTQPELSILVLEDEQNMRETLLDTLCDDYRVDGASSSEMAIDLAKKNTYDLMIADVRMGGPIDGIETVSRIKQKLQPDLLVIVLTGYADLEAPVRAMAAGVDFFLNKNDLVLTELMAQVKIVLDQRKDRTLLEHLLEPLLAGPRAFLRAYGAASHAKARRALDEARQTTYRALIIGIQSGRLQQGAALEIRDQLTALDAIYLKVSKPEHMMELLRRYRALVEKLPSWDNLCSAYHKPRPEGSVDLVSWRTLFQRIKAGQVNAAQLQMSEQLRLKKPPASEGELTRIFHLLWANCS